MATLEITFRGLCLFVPDPETGTVNVLMPNTHQHSRQQHWDSGSTYTVRLLHPSLPVMGIPIEGWTLQVGGASGAADTSLQPAVPRDGEGEIVDLTRIVAARINPRIMEDRSAIVSRVILRDGRINGLHAMAKWQLAGRKTEMADEVTWRIEGDFDELLSWIGSDPQAPPVRSLLELNPDPDGTFRLTVSHLPEDAFSTGQTSLSPGEIQSHFGAYYSLYDRPASAELPVFHSVVGESVEYHSFASPVASGTLAVGAGSSSSGRSGSSAASTAELGRPPEDPDPPPRTTHPNVEPVLLGAAAQKRVQPGDAFTADFVAYVKAFENEAARLLGRDRQPVLGVKTTTPWLRGSRVQVRLHGEGVTILEPEQSFEWDGEYRQLQFEIRVPENAPERQTVLRFDVLIGPLLVGRVSLNLKISRSASRGRARASATAEAIRRAFVSYSHVDRVQVLKALAVIAPLFPTEDFFVDLVSLQTGERWEETLEKAIEACDRFLLFWSRNAQASRFVKREWTYALDTHGDGVLQLLLLERVESTKVPRRLKKYQVDSHWLRLAEQEQSV